MLIKKRSLKYTLVIVISLFILVLGLAGCSSSTDNAKDTKKANNKVITSTDGKLQLTVPENWQTEKGLNEQAVIQVAHKTLEKYLIVISEDKSNFSEEIKLDDYLKAINKNFTENIKNVKISTAKDITINGYPAKQFEVNGEVDKVKAAYLVTLVNTSKSINQIMAWTLQTNFSRYKTEFSTVTNSFKEVK